MWGSGWELFPFPFSLLCCKEEVTRGRPHASGGYNQPHEYKSGPHFRVVYRITFLSRFRKMCEPLCNGFYLQDPSNVKKIQGWNACMLTYLCQNQFSKSGTIRRPCCFRFTFTIPPLLSNDNNKKGQRFLQCPCRS